MYSMGVTSMPVVDRGGKRPLGRSLPHHRRTGHLSVGSMNSVWLQSSASAHSAGGASYRTPATPEYERRTNKSERHAKNAQYGGPCLDGVHDLCRNEEHRSDPKFRSHVWEISTADSGTLVCADLRQVGKSRGSQTPPKSGTLLRANGYRRSLGWPLAVLQAEV